LNKPVRDGGFFFCTPQWLTHTRIQP